MLRPSSLLLLAAAASALAAGCSRRETDVERGNREGILFLASGGEPRDIDPTTNIGSAENRIISTLFEGLVVNSPDGKSIVPAAAETDSHDRLPRKQLK